MISDVPQNCDNSSIRVSRLEGNAVILEVAIENVTKEVLREDPAAEPENPDEDKAVLLQKKKELEERKLKTIKEIDEREALLLEERARLEKERIWIESYAQQQNSAASGVKLSLEAATTFLSFYSESQQRLDARFEETDREIQELAERKRNLVEVRRVKSVYLLLGDAHGALSFSLSYVMLNAGWKPAYDIRVQSSNTSAVELTYHGVITNSTGENWKDVELSLSTAQPQIGGNPPALATLTAHFPRPVYYNDDVRTMRSMIKSEEFKRGSKSKNSNRADDGVAVADVKQNATSTTFSIPRRATINSDSHPHKVTIDIVVLEGVFSHIITPKLAQHAYLRSKSTNSTDFPFIAGRANVFMDDTFVASSELKTTNPGEEIVLYLGSDPTVVVEFKESFFKTTKGMVGKVIQAKYQHDIVVKNSKGTEISCEIFDQLPKSQEDKVKVVVLRPRLEEREREGACMLIPENSSVRWRVKVPAGKNFETTFEYQIDYPADKLIDFVV